jgi:hypothetical protein
MTTPSIRNGGPVGANEDTGLPEQRGDLAGAALCGIFFAPFRMARCAAGHRNARHRNDTV